MAHTTHTHIHTHTHTHTNTHTHRHIHTDRIIMKRKYEDDIPYTNSKYSTTSKLLLKAKLSYI